MNEATMKKMHQMKLFGMQQSLQAIQESKQNQALTNDEFINLLIQSEWDDRQNRKITRNLKAAKFRYNASIEEIDFITQRNVEKTQLLRIADCAFIRRKENVLITGATGVGKSFIASAIGNQACIKGYKVLYFNTQKLFPKLIQAKADGTYIKEINRIEKHDLLILDDFGLQALDNQNRMALMEIIEDRHNRKSTIISSQLPVDKWYDIIGDSTIADAILDRMINSAHRIELKGSSMRKKKV